MSAPGQALTRKAALEQREPTLRPITRELPFSGTAFARIFDTNQPGSPWERGSHAAGTVARESTARGPF